LLAHCADSHVRTRTRGVGGGIPETLLLRQVKGSGRSLACLRPHAGDPTRFAKAVPLAILVWSSATGFGESSPTPHQQEVTPSSDDCWWQRSVHSRSFGEDCDLRRHGMKLGASGSKKDKTSRGRRCTQAGVLLHRLWQSQATYDPLYTPTNCQHEPRCLREQTTPPREMLL